ncbi:hypothetical protein PG994_015384 [Apiospora phragmitis]|uniref:Reverse transcriptase domain-containing protein n=1 Tax=Apiospora phragmitis TaxID=2905665 RepID=A0ABR1SRD5_9PEZI
MADNSKKEYAVTNTRPFNRRRPDHQTWPKLVAHFVPTSLSPTSCAEEVQRFNNIEIQANVRWLSNPEGKAHSSMVFATQERDRAECLKNGIWIQGQHLQVVHFKSFTPKTQCRRCLKLGNDPVLCKRRYVCGYCAGRHPTKEHSCKDCNSKVPCAHAPAKFANCNQTGHTAFDKDKCEVASQPAIPIPDRPGAPITHPLPSGTLFQDKGPQGSGLYSCISHPSFRPLLPQETTDLSSIKTRPRVMTYIRKSFSFDVNPSFDLVSDPDMQVLEVITPIEHFYIVNIYNQADEKKSFTVQRFLDLHLPITPALIVGDLNLHHPWWNPLAKSSPLAERLTCHLHSVQATLLIDHATIESHGGTFHRPNSKKTSIIDLAFSIGFRSLHWQDWSYLPGTGSDHEAVSLRAFLPAYQTARPLPPQFCTEKTNWEKFRKRLEEVAVSLESTIDAAANRGDFDGVASSLQQAVQEATNGSIPVKRPCDRSKAWWCPELTDQRMRYHRAFRRYKRDPSRDTETACKEARNSYFQAIDRAKTDHWFTFLAEAKGKEIFTAYNYTKPRTDPSIPSLRYEVNGKVEIANSFSGKCEALVSTLLKRPQQLDHPPSPSTLPPLPPPSPTGPRSRARSSKGDWQWPILTPSEIERLSRTWKTAIGIVLPKRNKPDYSRPKAYPPISLLPCLSKLLEKLFANRLAYLANVEPDLLESSQIGGRKQRSAIDAALLLQHYIERHRQEKKIITAIFLPDKLIQILRKLHLPDELLRWLTHFLCGRKIKLLFNGQLSESYAISGLPQGSPVSPILFLLYVRFVSAQNGTLQLSYMDDFALAASSTSAKKNCRVLQDALRLLFDKADKAGATFEVEKTELIHFHRGRQPLLDTIDPRRGNQAQILEKRLTLANGALQGIQRITRQRTGLGINALRQLYVTCVSTVADYGSLLWFERRGCQSLWEQYQKLQNRALATIKGVNQPTKSTKSVTALNH